MNRGIQNGEVVPINYTTFESHQAEDAFRFMANGKHVGKVLIKIRDEFKEPIPQYPLRNCIAQTFFDHFKCYIITGGLGGFGLELANWMVSKGAVKLIITTRNGLQTSYQKLAIKRLKEYTYFKTNIMIIKNSAQTYESAASLIKECQQVAPIGGIFNLAMVLSDAILENQTVESYEKVCAPKVNTVLYLDELTRKQCPELDYFVCFSSVSAARGNPGQSNYGFANTFIEKVCEERRKVGLHGLAIQWGAIGDVGIVAETMGGNDVVIGGTVPQRIPSCMEVLEKFLQSQITVGSSLVLVDSRKLYGLGKESLLKTITHILGVKDSASLDPNTTLNDLGLDSLMAVEIKQGLERDYNIILSTQAIRDLKVKEIEEMDKKIDQVKVTQEEDIEAALTIENPKQLFIMLTKNIGHNVFFFPPLESDFKLIFPFFQNLGKTVVGVNWTDACNDFVSLQEAANYYFDQIRINYPNQNEFEIIGYSFGGLVAFETAIKLQEHFGNNCVRNLILLDSSPDYLKARVTSLKLYNENKGHHLSEENIILYVKQMISIEEAEKLKMDFNKINSMEERIQKMVNRISEKVGTPMNTATLLTAIDNYFKKVHLIYNYQVTREFSGEAILIRCSDVNLEKGKIEVEHDFGLSKVKLIVNLFY